jgi:hypothetical protein
MSGTSLSAPLAAHVLARAFASGTVQNTDRASLAAGLGDISQG